MKKIYQHFLKVKNKKYFFYFMISIIIILLIVINNSFFQTKIVNHILKNYNTNILIDNIRINLFIGNIKIKNFKILDKKKNILIYVPKIEGNINIFNFFFRKINIKNIIINNPKINIITYKNDSISNIDYFIKCFKQKNNKNIINDFSIINFNIKQAYIHIINNNKYIKLIFKGHYDCFSKKIIYYNKSIKSYISNIILKGRYINKNIHINFNNKNLVISNRKLIILNNNLIFNHSKIVNSFTLYYNKYEDLLNFYQNIFFEFIIKKGSYISYNDINLFINNKNFFLKKSIIYIQCNLRGRFNKYIDFLNVYIKSGKNIIKSKHIVLYKKNNNYLYFKKNTFIKTSFFDIKKILPFIFTKKIPVLLSNYGELKYYGSIIFTYKYIKFNGNFTSNKIGFCSGKIFFFNFKKLKDIKYKGKLYMKIYNLYPLLKNKNIKYINAEFIFYGKGYQLKNSNFKLNGTIKYIFLYNRKIHNINFNGYIYNNYLYGIFDINDNNINIKFDGKIIFYPHKYFLYGKIKLNYLNFHFINEKINNKSISCKEINICINWINLNNLKLNIYLNNLFYKNSNNISFIPKIYLKYKSLKQRYKKLKLSIYELMNLSFFGNFQWRELYYLLINNINKFKLLNYKEYNLGDSNQFLFFNIKINDNFIKFFDEKINYQFDCKIIGVLSDKKLVIYAKSNFLIKKIFFIKNINIILNNNKKYNIMMNINSIFYKKINIKNINISTLINNNILLIKVYFFLKIYNINQEFFLNFFKKDYYINGIKYILIGLSRSLIKINNNNLWINKKNETNYNIFKIDLKNRKFLVNELNFDLKNQKINLSSRDLYNNYNIIQGLLNNLRLKDFLYKKVLCKNCNISKIIFLIEKFSSIFLFEIKFKIHNLYINNNYIQNIKINIYYNKINKKYKIFFYIKNKNILYISGYIKNFLKRKEYINIKIHFYYFPIIFFKNFIQNTFSDTFSDIRGICTGIIRLKGYYNNINYKGYLYLNNLGIKINNINIDYESISKSLILFKNKTIILKNLIIRDTKYNSIGYVNGIIINEYNKWIISLYIDSKNLLVIDTNSINKKLIYGKIFAKGKIHLLGDINNLNINVTNAKISNYSKLFISTDNNESIISEQLEFLNKKNSNNTIKKENNSKKITINIESNIDEKCEIQLFFNSKKNTFIKARGVGNLFFKTNYSGEIEILGKYYIKNGYYQLNNTNIAIFNRKFKVRKGSTITWGGIPNNPKLNITAFYQKSVSNIEDYIKIPNLKKINSELIINIYGRLSQPNFIFDIDFPDINNNIKQKIIQKIYNKNERITQFVSIILLGKFFLKKKLLETYFLSFSKKNNIIKNLINIFLNKKNNTKINLYYYDTKSIKYSFIYDINKYFSIKGIIKIPISFKKESLNRELNIYFNKKLDKKLKIILFSRLYKEKIYNYHNIFFNKIYGGSLFYRISFDEMKYLYNIFFLEKKY